LRDLLHRRPPLADSPPTVGFSSAGSAAAVGVSRVTLRIAAKVPVSVLPVVILHVFRQNVARLLSLFLKCLPGAQHWVADEGVLR
jgi:hypothetical protein